MALIRPPMEPDVAPTYRTTWPGSQNEAMRDASAREVGRASSRRRSGTRSSHLPTRVSSSGAVTTGAGSSTM